MPSYLSAARWRWPTCVGVQVPRRERYTRRSAPPHDVPAGQPESPATANAREGGTHTRAAVRFASGAFVSSSGAVAVSVLALVLMLVLTSRALPPYTTRGSGGLGKDQRKRVKNTPASPPRPHAPASNMRSMQQGKRGQPAVGPPSGMRRMPRRCAGASANSHHLRVASPSRSAFRCLASAVDVRIPHSQPPRDG